MFEEIELTNEERANGFALRTRVSTTAHFKDSPTEGELFVDLFDRDGVYLCSVASAENVTEMNGQLTGLQAAISYFLGGR